MKAFVAVAIILTLAPLAPAQPLADRLPPATPVYIGWSPTAAMGQTKPARMLADESFTRPWRTLLIQLATWALDDHASAGNPEELPSLLADALQCEGCFAITELKISKALLRCQAALIINLGEKRKSFEAHFKPLHERIKTRLGGRVQVLKQKDSWLWVMPDRAQRPELIWGFLGDKFVMLWGAGSEELLKALESAPGEKSLKTAANFVEAQQRLPGEAITFTYVDGAAGLELLKHITSSYTGRDVAEMTLLWPLAISQLGLDNITYVAEKTTLADGNFLSNTLLRTSAAPKGILAAVAQGAVDEALLKTIPPEPMVAAAFRLDAAKTYEQLKSSLIAVFGDFAKTHFDEFEKESETAGLPINGVLGPIGDQWVVYNAPSTGGFVLTGWTTIGTIRDPQGFERTMQSLRRLLGDQRRNRDVIVEEIAVDGVVIQYLRASAGGGFVSPAWAVVGDKFILASYPQLVEDALRQMKSPKSILDDPAYQAARKRAGGEGAMLYVSGRQITRNTYPVLLAVMTAIEGFGGSNDGILLPSMQRLLDYVGDDLAALKGMPDGVMVTRSAENPLLSPVSIASPAVLILAALPELVWFSPDHARELTQKNLTAIGRAMTRYRDDHKDAAPNLNALVDAKLIDAEVLVSPIGKATGGADYIYIKPDAKQEKNTIMVYDAAELQQGNGVSVLWTNNSVQFFDKATFEKTLRGANDSPEAPQQAPQP